MPQISLDHMIPLDHLWLPIVVAAVGCFIASCLIWMVLPFHKGDYKKLPNEDEVIGVIKRGNIGPGMYMFPHCGGGKPDAAVMEKFKTGPSGYMNVRFGCHNMGKAMGIWMLHLLIMAGMTGYIASLILHTGSDFMHVARVVGTCGMLCWFGGLLPEVAWKGLPAKNFVTMLIDGLIYTAIFCAAFGMLWPKA